MCVKEWGNDFQKTGALYQLGPCSLLIHCARKLHLEWGVWRGLQAAQQPPRGQRRPVAYDKSGIGTETSTRKGGTSTRHLDLASQCQGGSLWASIPEGGAQDLEVDALHTVALQAHFDRHLRVSLLNTI